MANEDARRLLGRQLLYSWLCKLRLDATVEIEETVDQLSLPTPIDVVCHDGERQFGYYFVHGNLRRPDRDAIAKAIGPTEGLQLHVVLSHDLVSTHSDVKRWFHLSPAARELRSLRGARWPCGFGDSLHLLDVMTGNVTTIRSLTLFEKPKFYSADYRADHALSDTTIDNESGEIVHPGESDLLRAREEELRKRIEMENLTRPPTFIKARAVQRPVTYQVPTTGPVYLRQRDRVCEKCSFLTSEEDQVVSKVDSCICRYCMQ